MDGIEYRTWNPYRSKLAAAIVKGMSRLSIKSGSSVLYLGAATGTTVSHVSDIAGPSGRVYAVEISERSMRDFIKVCEARQNVLPILQDARKVEAYAGEVGTVDAIYEDIAAPDQAEILIRNSELLKKSGFAYVAIKSQSINVSRNPKEVYSDFIARVSERFRLVESFDIEPFDKMHLFVVLQKR